MNLNHIVIDSDTYLAGLKHKHDTEDGYYFFRSSVQIDKEKFIHFESQVFHEEFLSLKNFNSWKRKVDLLCVKLKKNRSWAKQPMITQLTIKLA